ncbi:MAG: hypothetical protein ACSLFH_01355 [Desulfuromonadales bacterium]
MTKRSWLVLAIAVLLLSLSYGCHPMRAGGKSCCAAAPQGGAMTPAMTPAMTSAMAPAMAPAMASAASQGERMDVLYSCACGDGCDCNSVSKTPGNCRCGKPMAWGHVVKVEGNEALLCTCGEGCMCQQDAANPTQCGCGNPLKRVNLEGTGMFFCNCGGSCTCNTISREAGNCKCGMPLKQR